MRNLSRSTEYFALGRGTGDLILIGPNDLLEDDVLDVTNTGLPVLDIDSYKKIFIDHDTPLVWVGHREVTAATPAGGTFTELPIGPVYFGAWYNDPTVTTAGSTLLQHAIRALGSVHLDIHLGGFGWFNEPCRSSHWVTILGFANPVWLGRQPDDATAARVD